MDDAMLRQLLLRLKALERDAITFRLGIVNTTAPLTVTLGASGVPQTNMKQVAGSALAVGNVVAVLDVGNDLLVLGRIV